MFAPKCVCAWVSMFICGLRGANILVLSTLGPNASVFDLLFLRGSCVLVSILLSSAVCCEAAELLTPTFFDLMRILLNPHSL